MNVKVIEKKSGKMKFKVKGADYTLINLLRQKLMERKGVEFATYSVPHPLLEGFVLTVRGKDPEAEVKKALGELKKETAEMSKVLKAAK